MNEHFLLDTKDDKGYRLTVSYQSGKFVVNVSAPEGGATMSKELVANYEPRWGIDVLDQEGIYRAADRMARQLEEQAQAEDVKARVVD